MSRWRETLCGSVVLGRAPESPDVSSLQAQSEILSCGGIYLPYQPTQKPFKKEKDLAVFHLAKEQYEVLLVDTPQEIQRYGESVPENPNEVPLFSEPRYLDLKHLK